MSLKNDILVYLSKETEKFDWEHPSEQLTANGMQKVFHVKRNTVSTYLNQLVKENLVIKINTRPVYFLSRSIFEKKFFNIPASILDSFQELQEYEPPKSDKHDVFDELIGAEGSLKKAIIQIKTSIFYPGGLPIMLCGPTGVGKSYTAELIYKFCLENDVLSPQAPFISFNCAQYANNPELLSSNLFGYIKGAFTGADATKNGLLAAANGGILFLDEVHRLNAEGQEKLFTFIDKGVYRRMGESEEKHKANVRLIFATTEDLEKNFLPTFLRRIPIRVTIPSLDERGEIEKKQFIYMFLINEARILNRPIKITDRALDALAKHHYTGNMGDLKNTIKYIVASSLVKNRTEDEAYITLQHLPENVIENAIPFIDTKIKKANDVMIKPDSTLEQLYKTSISHMQLIKGTYEKMIQIYREGMEKRFSGKEIEQTIMNEVTVLFDGLIFNPSKEKADILLQLITANVQETIQYLEKSHNIRFNGNNIYAIAYFLYYKGNGTIRWSKNQAVSIDKLLQYMHDNYKTEQLLVKQFVNLLENKLDVKLDKMDEICLTLYMRNLVIEKTNEMKAVILAHGFATASSIANVANRLLKKNIFEAFDMPIDVSAEDIAAQVIHYIEHNDVSKGLIILVDMGSLKDIDTLFKKTVNAPVAIVNNVTTQMALYLGSMLDKNLLLEEMVEKLKAIQTDYKVIYPEKEEKEKLIISSCQTGMGTAIQIQKLLEKSIPADMAIKVMAYDYHRLKELGMSETIFQLYDVIAIVGTANPHIDQVPYLSLEDIITGNGEEKMRDIFLPIVSEERFKEINKNIVWNCSLERVIDSITILDSEKILSHVEEFVNRLEMSINERISNRKRIALYVHVSCLVERLIRQVPIKEYPNLDEFKQRQKGLIHYIQEAFSVIESIYNVKINIAEVGYIYDIVTASYDQHKAS